jgi:hemoglobin
MTQTVSKSLYERLGGGERISAIINDAIDLHLKNPLIAPRFQKSDVAKLKRLGHEFFCAGAGGPECYSGREMRAAHAGMNISEQEYMTTMDDIVQAMVKHDVPQAERNEVVAILFSLKNDILRK